MTEDHWTPVRYVAHEQTCYFCRRRIPKASPGATKGTRGTKAFFESTARLWQCDECMVEHTRAQLARERIADKIRG